MQKQHQYQSPCNRRYLQPFYGESVSCWGIFIRKVWNQNTHGANRILRLSVLVRHIFETHGMFTVDHAWILVDHDKLKFAMHKGDKIRFRCNVHRYYKGKYNQRQSYGFKAFRDAKKVQRIKITIV